MGKELIERIDNLPRERVVVHVKANQEGIEAGTDSARAAHVVEHWKPLLIVLIGRAENLDRKVAEEGYEKFMEAVGNPDPGRS